MKDQQIGLREILTSGSWYALPAIWGFFAFIRMAAHQLDKLVIACAVGFSVVIVGYVVYVIAHMRRYGKQPSKDGERSALRTIGGPVFSIVWSAFVVGCIFTLFVVIEYNDPFTPEAIDRVSTEHGAVFWSIGAFGATIGAIDRIWRLVRSPSVDNTPQSEILPRE